MDLYALVAITPSLETLDGLIAMVKGDNDFRQDELDTRGATYPRNLDVSDGCSCTSMR
jgi:hypothetical protein